MKSILLQSGFTLVELLITIAVAAILLTLAIPNFNTVIKNNRLSTSANQLVSYLSLARSEAIKRGVDVSICKSTDQANCTTAAGDNWEDGWIVFVDNNGNRSINAGDTIIRVHQGLPRNTLRGDSNIANAACFSSRGFGSCAGGNSDGTFNLCDDRADTNTARSIDIALTGRVRTTTTTGTCP